MVRYKSCICLGGIGTGNGKLEEEGEVVLIWSRWRSFYFYFYFYLSPFAFSLLPLLPAAAIRDKQSWKEEADSG